MTAVLSVRDGRHVGRTIQITPSGVVVGRDDFPSDRRMSRQHARFSFAASGLPIVRDLESANGTYVNGRRLSAPRRLHDGDTIQLGDTTLQVGLREPQFEDTESFERVPRRRPERRRISIGSARATHGGVVVGHAEGEINTHDNRHYHADTISGATGFARFIIGLGLVIFLIGFGLFAYPIVMAISEGFSGNLQPGQSPSVDFVPMLPVGFGLAAVGAALLQIGIFLKR